MVRRIAGVLQSAINGDSDYPALDTISRTHPDPPKAIGPFRPGEHLEAGAIGQQA